MLIVALFGLLALQFAIPRRAESTEPARPMTPAPAPISVAPTEVAPAILLHPIFSPTREQGGGTATATSAPQLSDYTLLGTTRARGFASATLSGPGGRLIDLRFGQTLLGWRLEAVSGESVIFASNGQTRRLTAGAPPMASSALLH